MAVKRNDVTRGSKDAKKKDKVSSGRKKAVLKKKTAAVISPRKMHVSKEKEGKSPIKKTAKAPTTEKAEKALETTSWKYFEKNGSMQIKIYTESQAVFSKLAGIQGIQKSAKYFVKGHQVGVDFIVPLDLAEMVCGIAGVKIPKFIVRKPE